MTDVRALLVKDAMVENPVCVHEDETMMAAEIIFSTYNIHHVPVIDEEGKLKGILSKQDLELLKNWATKLNLKAARQSNDQLLNSSYVKERMSTEVVIVSPINSLKHCANIFSKNAFHALPVVDNDKVIGIITTFDLINIAFL